MARVFEPVAAHSKRRAPGEAPTLDARDLGHRPLRHSAYADRSGARAGPVSRGTARHGDIVVGRSALVALSGEVLDSHEVCSGSSSVAEASWRCPDRSRPTWPLDGTGSSPGPRAWRANRRRETCRGHSASGRTPGRVSDWWKALRIVGNAAPSRGRARRRSWLSNGRWLEGRREERQRRAELVSDGANSPSRSLRSEPKWVRRREVLNPPVAPGGGWYPNGVRVLVFDMWVAWVGSTHSRSAEPRSGLRRASEVDVRGALMAPAERKPGEWGAEPPRRVPRPVDDSRDALPARARIRPWTFGIDAVFAPQWRVQWGVASRGSRMPSGPAAVPAVQGLRGRS